MKILLLLAALLLPPCEWEDSNNCYWDAANRGDGYGRSFITIADHPLHLE